MQYYFENLCNTTVLIDYKNSLILSAFNKKLFNLK